MNCFSLDIFKFISLLLSFNSLNRMYLMWLCIFLRVEFLRCVGFFNQFEKFSAIMSLNNLLQLHICWYFCYSTSFWDGSFFLIHSSVLQIVSFLWVFFWVHWFFFFFLLLSGICCQVPVVYFSSQLLCFSTPESPLVLFLMPLSFLEIAICAFIVVMLFVFFKHNFL